MFVAGVACDDNTAEWLISIGVKDSKKLAKHKRFELSDKIFASDDLHVCVVEKTFDEIDTLGLSACLKRSIEEIIKKLIGFSRDFYMDGNTLFGLKSTQRYNLASLIKGDDKIPQISAASIVAKTSKDLQMLYLDNLYPQYGFKSNAGYGTKAHIEAIQKFGRIKEHRRSFVLQNKLF